MILKTNKVEKIKEKETKESRRQGKTGRDVRQVEKKKTDRGFLRESQILLSWKVSMHGSEAERQTRETDQAGSSSYLLPCTEDEPKDGWAVWVRPWHLSLTPWLGSTYPAYSWPDPALAPKVSQAPARDKTQSHPFWPFPSPRSDSSLSIFFYFLPLG